MNSIEIPKLIKSSDYQNSQINISKIVSQKSPKKQDIK